MLEPDLHNLEVLSQIDKWTQAVRDKHLNMKLENNE